MNLSTSIGPRSDPATDMRAEKPKPCVGCGGLHGGVNIQIHCLETHLLAARAELAPIKALRDEISKQPLSWNAKNAGKR